MFFTFKAIEPLETIFKEPEERNEMSYETSPKDEETLKDNLKEFYATELRVLASKYP